MSVRTGIGRYWGSSANAQQELYQVQCQNHCQHSQYQIPEHVACQSSVERIQEIYHKKIQELISHAVFFVLDKPARLHWFFAMYAEYGGTDTKDQGAAIEVKNFRAFVVTLQS
jgi:hypothetical protein